MTDRICWGCEHYQLVGSKRHRYWYCKKQNRQILENKCEDYELKSKNKKLKKILEVEDEIKRRNTK